MIPSTHAGLARAYALLVLDGNPFTIHEVSATSGYSTSTAGKEVQSWIAQGRVERTDQKRGARHLFRARPSELRRLESAKSDDPYQNMWFIMRRNKCFQPSDIAMRASVGTVEISTAMAADYCWFLNQAHYLHLSHEGRRGLLDHTYRLVRDTGPLAPEPQWRLAAYDPNLGRVSHADGMSVR